jgi:hypothetical protein
MDRVASMQLCNLGKSLAQVQWEDFVRMGEVTWLLKAPWKAPSDADSIEALKQCQTERIIEVAQDAACRVEHTRAYTSQQFKSSNLVL